MEEWSSLNFSRTASAAAEAAAMRDDARWRKARFGAVAVRAADL